MRAWLNTAWQKVLQFRRNSRAVAVVEFALILPFLITLYLGSIEASSLFAVDRRVTTISGTVGDLVSRWNQSDGTMPGSTMTDYFQAAQGIITPYSTTGLKQVVTCIQVLSDGTTKVMWSRAYNGGVARTVNATYPLSATAQMNQIGRGGYLIVSETSYSYRPLLGYVFKTNINLYRETFYVPRFGATQYINPPTT